jgi:sugar phosphate isomerase/epimerase
LPFSASISLSGLTLHAAAPWSDNARSAIAWACSLAPNAVQLDATMRGVRPRELDRSARREVRSMLTRRGVAMSGLDFFIPVAHYVESAHVDRALAALRETIEMAAEMRDSGVTPSVSLELPAKIDSGTLSTIEAMSQRAGVTLADHAWPLREAGNASRSSIRVGIDPATLLSAGVDVISEVAKLAESPASARVSDWSSIGRAEAGSTAGQLDLLAYAVTLSTKQYIRPLVIDLRSVRDQAAIAARVLARVRSLV